MAPERGKGGVTGDFAEEVIAIMAISYRWSNIVVDLAKSAYHRHIKPELRHRIKDLSLMPQRIEKEIEDGLDSKECEECGGHIT